MRRKILFVMSSNPAASDLGVQMARMAISVGLDHDLCMVFKDGARQLLRKPTVFGGTMHNFENEARFLDELEIPRYQFVDSDDDDGFVETDNANVYRLSQCAYDSLVSNADLIFHI